MIISKRNHLDKMEMARPLQSLITQLTSSDEKELVAVINQNLKWERPRGDLFHWVSVLNRFDEIFERLIKAYGLDDEHPRLREVSGEDETLLVACLNFTYLLMDHCANRSIYASTERIYSLLNTVLVDVRVAALEVAVCLAERYVHVGLSSLAAPKPVILRVVQLAKFFPPPVPSGFIKDDGELDNHYSLLDTLTSRKYPPKWRSLHFHYYRLEPRSNEPRSKKQKHEGPAEGLSEFVLGEDAVRKLSLEQIYDKASEVVPKENWYEFALEAHATKAFNTKTYDSIHLREKLLRIKCLAIAFVCCMCTISFTTTRLFESDPYIVSFLVDFVLPENLQTVPRPVYFAAVKALECISMKRMWSSEIIRCMGGSVTHGTLFQIIRQIHQKVANEEEDVFEKAYIHFFNMVSNLIDLKSPSRLTAGGILNDMMLFLETKSKYRWSCSAVVHLILRYLRASPDSFSTFVDNDGFTKLINTVNYEVEFALANPHYGGGAPKEAVVHYSITFRQANYIRNLLKLVSHLIQSQSGDQLRNLFDLSILFSFNKVMENPTLFGPHILSATIDVIFFIIHNEPTAYSILKEANVIDTFLSNYEHFFLPSEDLLVSLADVLGAVALNKEGLAKIAERKIIQKFFQSFYSLQLAKELVKPDLRLNVGASFDELRRHHPDLEPHLLELVQLLVKDMPDYVELKLDGARLYDALHDKEVSSWDSCDAAYILDNVYSFLAGLLQDSGQWGDQIIALVPYEHWIRLLTIDSPFDYTLSSGFSSLMRVFKYFDDEDRDYGLPKLVGAIGERLQTPTIRDFLAGGGISTSLLKELNVLTTLFHTLTEIYVNPTFMFHERYHQLADLYGEETDVIDTMGALFKRCAETEVYIRSNIDETLLFPTKPTAEVEQLPPLPPLQPHIEKPGPDAPKPDEKSLEYKNALQTRFFLHRLQVHIGVVFTCLGRLCMMKRQDNTLADWRRKAVAITVKLAEVLTSLLDVSDESVLLVTIHLGASVIVQKERAKDVTQTSLVVLLISVGYFQKLRQVAVLLWQENLGLDPAKIKQALEVEHILLTKESIVHRAMNETFLLFARTTNHESYQKLPSAALFFHYGFPGVENRLIPSILVFVRAEGLQLLKNTVLTISKESTPVITNHLLIRLIELYRLVWRGQLEQDSQSVVPLDVRNVTPPINQVEYLEEHGLTPSQSDHFFKHVSDVHAMQRVKWTDCGEMGLTESQWDKLRDHAAGLNFVLEYPDHHRKEELDEQRQEHKRHFHNAWILVLSLWPDTSKSLVNAFKATNQNLDTTLHELVDRAQHTDVDTRQREAAVELIFYLLKNDEDGTDRGPVFERFYTHFFGQLKQNVEGGVLLNDMLIAYAFDLVAQYMSYRAIPQPEESKHTFSLVRERPSTLSDAQVDELWQVVSKIPSQPVERIGDAFGLAKVLVLFAREPAYTTKVSRIPLFRVLVSHVGVFYQQKHFLFDTYQLVISVLVRLCFEQPEVLSTLFSAEITAIFSLRDKKMNLPMVFNVANSLIFRNSDVFVDVFSGLVRLNNYDGGLISTTSLLVSLKDEEPADEPEKKLPPLESSGIVHLLITELMEVSKKDWVSDPTDEDKLSEKDKRKNHDLVVLMKNNHFAYACFLLKCLTELVGSYKQAKLEFLTFSRKNRPNDSVKPRLTALNFLVHQLVPTQPLIKTGNEWERRNAVSSLAKLCVLSLVSTVPLERNKKPDPHKEDADMAIIRKFVVEILLRIMKDTCKSDAVANARYGKLIDLFDLVGSLINTKFRDLSGPLLNKHATHYDTFFLTRNLVEKQVPQQITEILGEVDLNFPSVHRVVKAGLKPLKYLSKVKTDFQDLFQENSKGVEDEDIVPDVEDDDDTPDLFRNSTLGMYDVDDESDEEDFYDDDPLEIMSGDDMEEELDELESDIDSDIESGEEASDMDEDGYSIEDGYEGEFEGEYGEEYEGEFEEDSEEYDDDGDIEIIDELAIEDGQEAGLDEEELAADDLDGWIDAFEGSEDEPSGEYDAAHTSHDSIDEDGDDMDDDDLEDEDGDEEHFIHHRGHNRQHMRAGEFATSFFDALGPAISGGQSLIASLLGGLFSTAGDDGRRLLRGLVQIGDQAPMLHFDRTLLDRALEMFRERKSANDPLGSLYVNSTAERWDELLDGFFRKSDRLLNVLPAVFNRIEADSLDFFNKKMEELEAARQRREEKAKQREAERLQREQEARDAAAEMSTELVHEPVMVMIGDREVDIGGTDIDPEFFEALPDDMREEVFTQHVRERRANASSTGTDAREIDPDFLDALPDHLREEILQQESMARRFTVEDLGSEDEDEQEEEEHQEEKEPEEKRKRTFFTPLVEKSGVASLIRLLFVPQHANNRDPINNTLLALCHNKQQRVDVMTLLMGILHDGLHTQRSMEKVYHQICVRSFIKVKSQFPTGATPLVVGLQVIEAIHFLLEHNPHLRFYFLVEHDNTFVRKKNKLSLAKEDKYPINFLLRLISNKNVQHEQTFIDVLTRVLAIATRPLQVLISQKDKPFTPPVITDHNYRQIIKVLTSNDCPNTTFRRVISAMQSLSLMAHAQKVLSVELSDQATSLGQRIINDLNALTRELKLDADTVTFAKFSAASSDQAKLLRILTALDYMFELKEEREEDPTGRRMSIDDIEELTGLYKRLALGSLWDALSDCLRVLEENPSMQSVATVLLPLIEALMVVCKHLKVRELQIKDVVKYEARKIDFTKEPIERLFFSFTDEHKKILNHMVRTNPNLMSGPFGMLVRNPRVLEFDNKKNYFDRQLHSNKNEDSKLAIQVRRDQVFLDSYRSLFFKSRDEFRDSKLEIQFKGEQGIDAGGVTREWYQVLSRQMFNPDYALFTPVASDETTFHPNRTSYINPEHLSFFKFIGRIIGKAIYDGSYLDCHFSRAVYKRILGKQVSLKDMENLDLEYFKSLMWMLENDITDVITEDFSVETDDYGEHKIIDLVDNGRNIPVTEENKLEYVQLVVEYRLTTSVAEQMNNFIAGFHEVIPKELVAIFDEQELELLISGLPDINVDDWKNNTTYNNYSPSSIQVQWFWRAVKSFDNEERAKLLQFATGTSKVPLDGFKALSGANGTCKFSIHRDYGLTDRLPSSHTCFNQIDLPAYETYETLRGSLLLAVTEGHEGFGLA